MRVAIMNSGGKDSASAWWWTLCRGWEITNLITVRVTGGDSHMFQIPGIDVSKVQAEIAGITYTEVEVGGEQNEEIEELRSALVHLDIDGLVVGALRSDYQKSRLERMCEQLDIHIWTPLWHQNGEAHVRQLIENKFKVMISGVSCEGLDASWLGKILSMDDFCDLKRLSQKFRFHVDGEGGEYETIVLAGPHLSNDITIKYDTHWDGKRGSIHITECFPWRV
ncbi:MAG: diphthine--ammonia ligase [archaeon]|nr:diphthine--ammonia ligase [archaeon]MDA0842612.1 diphthine--ammonia ligase [archaeon]